MFYLNNNWVFKMFIFFKGNELSDNYKLQMSEIYRECFGYLPWGEYLKCTNINCKNQLSINEVYNLKGNDYTPLSELEKNLKNPVICNFCNSEMKHFWESTFLIESINKKSKKDLSVVLFMDKDKVLGCTYGYSTSFKDAWDLECKHLYNDNYYNLLKNLITKKSSKIIYDDTGIYVWNIMTILQPYRSFDNFFNLCRNFFNNQTEDNDNKITFGETKINIPLYINLKLAGAEAILRTEFENCIFFINKHLSNNRLFFTRNNEQIRYKYSDKYNYYLTLQKNGKFDELLNEDIPVYLK